MRKTTEKWNEQRRPVIMIDYDDVIFNFLDEVIKKYNEIEPGSDLSIEQITDWDLSKFGKIEVFNKIFKDSTLWEGLKERGNALATIQSLINDGRYKILIVSACESIDEYKVKVDVIQRKLPGFDMTKILSIQDKSMIRADLIVDDRAANLDACLKKGMQCVLVNMPHNMRRKEYKRIDSLEELPKIIENIFY